MSLQEYKQFKDPIHGYIRIPQKIVNTFIDTALFQRLRKIEQTSMRCLYPAARHDRFIHSLGVYYIGKRTVVSLFNNISCDVLDKVFDGKTDEQKSIEINKIIKSFEIACLMHDCAHSPFSHTYEKHYIDNKTHKRTEYIDKINGLIGDQANISQTIESNEHEILSSYILLRRHKEDIIEIGADPELVVRCILGADYSITDGKLLFDMYNAVIGLLNSRDSIDVDKLDYILRDTYESGVENLSIDIDRFISSVTLVTTRSSSKLLLGYKKGCLSVLVSIMYARDYLFRWIYNHHKVIYIAKMQNLLLDKANQIFNSKSEYFIAKIFDSENFFAHYELKEDGENPRKFTLNLVDDGDINYIFKELCSNLTEYKAVYHKKQHISVWKSFAEYKLFFEGSIKKSDQLKQMVDTIVNKYCSTNDNYGTSDFIVEPIKLKVNLGWIDPEVIYVLFGDEARSLHNIYGATQSGAMANKESFFYFYIPNRLSDEEKTELIGMIKSNI